MIPRAPFRRKDGTVLWAALAAVLFAALGARPGAAPLPVPGEAGADAPAAAAPGPGGAPEGSEGNAESGPAPVATLFVRPLTAGEPGSHDSNPSWSPDGSLIAFERSAGDGREIVVARLDGTVVETIGKTGGTAASSIPVPGLSGGASFNAGTTWSPSGKRFLFMGNAGEGNYDLYLRQVGGGPALRLTEHGEKDGHAHWSPVSDEFAVYVSGRTGRGDLYLLDVMTGKSDRLARGSRGYLYPRWSPDGRRIAATYGRNENHDILVIDEVARPRQRIRALTTWSWDDLRPAWSPDGRKIAFYSNYNDGGDPRSWCIVVVDAAGGDPTGGSGLAARVVAREVVPDVEAGPAWTPDGAAIVYVKDDRREYNPIYLAEIATKRERPVVTDTKMNHDVACGPDGLIAFRAQIDQWDRLFVARLAPRAGS